MLNQLLRSSGLICTHAPSTSSHLRPRPCRPSRRLAPHVCPSARASGAPSRAHGGQRAPSGPRPRCPLPRGPRAAAAKPPKSLHATNAGGSFGIYLERLASTIEVGAAALAEPPLPPPSVCSPPSALQATNAARGGWHDRACRQGSPAATAADSDGLVQQHVHAGDAGEAPERLHAAQSVFFAAQAMICEPSCHRRAA